MKVVLSLYLFAMFYIQLLLNVCVFFIHINSSTTSQSYMNRLSLLTLGVLCGWVIGFLGSWTTFSVGGD